MSDSGASDIKSHLSDEANDEDFSVNAFLSPLGGGRDENDHDDDVHSNLTRSRASSLASADITFSLNFDTANNIPFEYVVNSEVSCHQLLSSPSHQNTTCLTWRFFCLFVLPRVVLLFLLCLSPLTRA